MVAFLLALVVVIATAWSAAAAAEPPRLTAFDARPLSFEPVDSTTSSVFVARAHGTSVMISPTDVVLRVSAPLRKDPSWMPGRRAAMQRLRLALAGAIAGRATPSDRLRGQAHYFTGSDPSRWRTNVPMWGKVTFHEVYPGIDIVYYGSQGHLEFDFVVAPGADPSRIQLALESLDADDEVDLLPGGDGVRIAFPTGEVRLRPPHAYQDVDGVRRIVEVDYVIERKVDHPPRIALKLGQYDASRPLVIDPVLAYSSSFGISTDDAGLGIAVDTSGNTYVTGVADATAIDPTHDADVYVMKLDPSGAVAYAVYVGGTGDDGGTSIAVDANGNAYVAGGTSSTDFPTVGAAQDTNHGGTPQGTDAFVLKLSPTGTLLYSTYLGGTGDDGAYGVAVSSAGVVYVAGATKSTDFPVTAGTRAYGGAVDAFIAKIDPAVPGSAGIGYATYLGGTGDDIAYGIAVDTTGNAYVAGVTASSDFPTLLGFQSTTQGSTDAFVAKLGPDGTTLPWATYFGGSGPDVANGIAVDSTGFVYVTGSTFSPNLPQKAGTFPYGGAGDAFVAKFNPVVTLGSRSLLYSSFLGGTGLDTGRAIAVDSESSGYVVGFTDSSDFPKSHEVMGPQGGRDAFVAKLNLKTGGASALMYSTYLGGSGEDDAYGIALDAQGNAYVTGRTLSSNFPVVGTGASGFTGASDGFVARLVEPDLLVTALVVPTYGDPGGTIQVTDTTKNQGAATAGTSLTKFYLSVDAVLNTTDDPLVGTREVPELAAGADSAVPTTLTLPAPLATGSYTLFAVADADSTVAEAKEANNRISRTLRIGPDLSVTSVSAVISGTTLTATDTTTNLSVSPAPASTTYFYLAANATRSDSDTLLGTRSISELAGGGVSTASTPLTLPTGVTAGPYFLLAEADGNKVVTESNETNNVRARAITLGPDLAVSVLTIAAPGGAGLPVSATDTTVNQGATTATATVTRYFLSADAVFDVNVDTLLGERQVGELAPGATSTATVSLTLPANVSTGTYNIIAVADAGNAVTETLETNNTRTRTLAVGPDLRMSFVSGPTTTAAGSTISITDITRNAGGGPAPASRTKLYLSRDGSLTGAILLGSRAVPELAPNATDRVVTSVTIPVSTLGGAWFFVAQADGDSTVPETNETNNTLSAATTLVGPDLTVSVLTAQATAAAGASITINDTTQNIGLGPTGQTTVTRFYLSTDATFDSGVDIALGSRTIPTLSPNPDSNAGTTTVTIPANTGNGSYYIIAVADADNQIGDGNRANNVTTRSIAIGPDMVVQSLTAPARTGTGVTINVSDQTSNIGPGSALASETWYYLSPQQNSLAGAIKIGSRPIPALNANSGSLTTLQLMIPADTPTGAYYLIAKADGQDAITEVNETNNMASQQITVGGDLTVALLTAPVSAGIGATISVTDTTSNVGGGGVPASVTRFYLSRINTFDSTAVAIGQRNVLALGGVKTSTFTGPVTIPADTVAGSYWLLARADADGAVNEIDETNNVRAKAILIGPNLSVITVTGPVTGAAGSIITVGDSTKNLGQGTAPASVTRYYLSTDPTFDAGDTPIGSRNVPQLAAGALNTGTTSVTLPTGIGGTFYIIAKADGAESLGESDETDNADFKQIKIGPDLVVTALTAPAQAGSGVTIAVSDTTRNSGPVPSPESYTRFYLSTNTTFDPSTDIFLGKRFVPALNSGVSSTAVTNLLLPELLSGPYQILAVADGDETVPEVQELNNVRPRAINIGPDLIIDFSTAVQAAAGATITVNETVTNLGGGTAGPSRTVYYLSTTLVPGATDPIIGFRDVGSVAPGGGVSTGPATAVIPPGTAPGQYNIIAKVDSENAVNELIETHNMQVHTIRIGPDLTVSSMTAPTAAVVGGTITVAETVKNLTVADTVNGFVNYYYLSPDGTIGPSAKLIGQRVVAPIAAGGLSTGSAPSVIPADTVPGSYFIVVLADGGNDVPEYNEANNTRSKAITINP